MNASIATPVTDEEIVKLRELEAKATPGMWRHQPAETRRMRGFAQIFSVVTSDAHGDLVCWSDTDGSGCAVLSQREADHAFISEARNVFVPLLDALEMERKRTADLLDRCAALELALLRKGEPMTEPIADEEIARLRALFGPTSMTSAGPYEVDDETATGRVIMSASTGEHIATCRTRADAHALVEIVNTLPRLLDAVESERTGVARVVLCAAYWAAHAKGIPAVRGSAAIDLIREVADQAGVSTVGAFHWLELAEENGSSRDRLLIAINLAESAERRETAARR